ncbi:hypothetical protein MNAN1_003940 [Malassezia nana]|uniref:Uncharacterized protein n=1 Tax=Malassezia nana TaxID=180528 RepID=A0AAF0EN37_9BASI|nr:hypothetical protein MNAN1_003940 [Malassezia nana]
MPLDIWAPRFGPAIWSDDAREASDGDDEQVMQRLREARKRLDTLGDNDMCAVDDSLEPVVSLRASPVPRQRAQSQPGQSTRRATLIVRRHNSLGKETLPELSLDLTNVPFNALIDAERRRLSKDNTPTSAFVPDAIPAQELSGSRYGLAPYMNLEREEWLWTTDPPAQCPHAPGSSGNCSPTTRDAASQRVLHAQEAWVWAMSGPPTECPNVTL